MRQNHTPEKQKHWVYRKENRRILWFIQFVILIVAILPEFFMHHHASFEAQGIHLDASPTFYAWYGFLTCAAMVIAAKVLGYVLKRKDDYYDE